MRSYTGPPAHTTRRRPSAASAPAAQRDVRLARALDGVERIIDGDAATLALLAAVRSSAASADLVGLDRQLAALTLAVQRLVAEPAR